MNRTALLASVIMLAGSVLSGQEYKLGSKVPDFPLQNLQGGPVSYESLKGKTTVVMFVATQCPVSNDYNQRMIALHKDYAARGVNFVFINPNSTEPAGEVAEHAKSVGFGFPVYKDVNNVVADKFGATVTPEVFVMDAGGVMVYHGSIDDKRNPVQVTEQRLRSALDATMAGKAVAVSETKAFGCTIKRARKSS